MLQYEIINLHELYKDTCPKSDLTIVFYNCSQKLVGFLISSIAMRYILHDDSIIIFEYDKKIAPNINAFYAHVIVYVLAHTQEKLNSYALEFSDCMFNCESQYVIYNNIYVELHVFYNDTITSYLSINGKQIQDELCNTFCNLDITYLETYSKIIALIENTILETAFAKIVVAC